MRALSQVVFVTSSAHKHREAEAILGLALTRRAIDLVEPQTLDILAVTRHKARLAHSMLHEAVLVEDTSLELTALGGFPGPLVRWLLEAASPAALARILDGFPDRSAVARCVALVFDGTREWVGQGTVAGSIAGEPRGASGFGWDVVFVPEWADGRTYAEMTSEEKNARSHRGLAFRDLRRRLEQGAPTAES